MASLFLFEKEEVERGYEYLRVCTTKTHRF